MIPKIQILEFIQNNHEGIIASLIAASAFALFALIVKWIVNSLRNRKYKALADTYNLYRFDSELKGRVVYSKLRIYSTWGILRASEDDVEYRYRGYVKILDKNLFILMKGQDHGEILNHVFNMPLHGNIKKLWGVTSSISVNRVPCVKRCLLIKGGLSCQEVKEEFDNEYGMDECEKCKNKKRQIHVLLAPHKSISDDNLRSESKSVSVLKRIWQKISVNKRLNTDSC